MILVRDVLQVKWNEMDKVLAGLQASAEASDNSSRMRVLTDLSGKYFTLVVETKAESMDAYWEAMRAQFGESQSDAAQALGALVESGHREFFNIEFEGDDI